MRNLEFLDGGLDQIWGFGSIVFRMNLTGKVWKVFFDSNIRIFQLKKDGELEPCNCDLLGILNEGSRKFWESVDEFHMVAITWGVGKRFGREKGIREGLQEGITIGQKEGWKAGRRDAFDELVTARRMNEWE